MYLVGGWTNPSEKICSSNWTSSPIFGMKIQTIWNHHLGTGWVFLGGSLHWLSKFEMFNDSGPTNSSNLKYKICPMTNQCVKNEGDIVNREIWTEFAIHGVFGDMTPTQTKCTNSKGKPSEKITSNIFPSSLIPPQKNRWQLMTPKISPKKMTP